MYRIQGLIFARTERLLSDQKKSCCYWLRFDKGACFRQGSLAQMAGLQHEEQHNSKPLLDPAVSREEVSAINPRFRLWNVWRKSLCILGAYCGSQVAYQGIFTSLVLYLKRVRQESNASAAATVNTVLGTAYCSSVLAAFLSDGSLGRLWSSVLILTVLLLGCALLSIVTQLQLEAPAFFTFTLYLTGLGYGWFKPGLAALGGDQFHSSQERNTFYNWLFVSGTLGEIFALTVVIYLEDAGHWALGYWIVTAAVGIGVLCLLGMRGALHKARENPFKRILQVVVAATLKVRAKVTSDSDELYQPTSREANGADRILHTEKLRFLDKAAMVTGNEMRGGGASSWRLCSVTQVEEVKSLATILPLWGTLLCKSAATSQLTNLFVEQGDVMNAQVGSFEIAPASMSLFNMIARTLFAIAYGQVARIRQGRRRRQSREDASIGGPANIVATSAHAPAPTSTSTPLLQISIAFVADTLAIVAAAVVEIVRRSESESGNNISILWLIPQYALEGVGLVCGVIGEADFFYSSVGPGIRGLSSSLPVLSRGLGSYISSLLITIVTSITTRGGGAGWIADDLDEGHLDSFFFLMVGIMVIDFLIFLILASGYTYPIEEET